MKIALLTDTHQGARNDSPIFDAFFEKFYRECFFPYIKEHNITTIVHLGDAFDKRKTINFQTLKNCKRYLYDEIRNAGIDMHMLAGNHDTAYKNTNEVNSLDILLAEYDNITTYSDFKVVDFDGTPILLMPWICSDNYESSITELKRSRADICFGHFEIASFSMSKGNVNEHGMPPDVFDRFDLVCSGHFHHRSTKGNITYLGSPYEITSADYNDARGFHVFDTKTRELEFVPNPFTIFDKFYYDDSTYDPDGIDVADVTGKFVKVVVIHKTDPVKFERFIERINKRQPADLKIVEDYSEFESDVVDDDNIDLADTFTLLSSYIDSIETDADLERVKGYMKSLYLEALHQET